MNKKLFKNFFIWYVSLLTIICIVLSIISHFTTLTPTAYFDVFRSFTIVYIIIVVYDIFEDKENTQKPKQQINNVENPSSIVKEKPVKVGTENEMSKVQRLYHRLFRSNYTITEICEIFTGITVINSLMMIFYIDTPKIGEFAYKHLLMRLSIITVFMIVFEYKSIVEETKELFLKIRNTSNISSFDFIYLLKLKLITNKLEVVSILFTLSTVVYCLIFIFLVKTPVGGVSLYFSLLVLFSVIIVIVFFTYMIIRNQKR